MKLLIVAATKQELKEIFDHFNLEDNNFVEFQDFDILITGVGITATAFALGRHLKADYSLVLNVGIAGTFDSNIQIGDLVNVKEDILAELGAEDDSDFISIEKLGFGKSTFTSTYQGDEELVKSLPLVNGITVNTVHGNEQSIKIINQRLNPQVESMEGAAVFYACEQLNIPSLQVRSISNAVTVRDTSNWQIPLAINNLNKWLIKYIEAANAK